MTSWKRRSQSGFTMLELMAGVAILVVLFAVGMYFALDYQKKIDQTDMDGKAETIYMAAQARMTALRTSSNSDKFQEIGDDIGNGLVRVKSSDPEAKKLILAQGLVEADLEDKNWIIEYDKETGTVTSVFYSEDDSLFVYDDTQLEGFRNLTTPEKDGRLDVTKGHVGYYGSNGEDFAKDKKILFNDPDKDENEQPVSIDVVNGESLTAKITCRAPEKDPVNIKMVVRGIKSGAIRVYDLDESVSNNKNSKGLYECATETKVLDDLRQDSTRFYNAVYDGAMDNAGLGELYERDFLPGEDIQISAQVTGGKYLYYTNGTEKNVNSLYNLVDSYANSEKTAYVAQVKCCRHVQNLDEQISNVAVNFVNVKQVGDIDFNNAHIPHECTGDNNFVPILNDKIVQYRGYNAEAKKAEVYEIKNMTATAVGQDQNAGLFATVKNDMSIADLAMTSCDVTAGENGSAGVLIGSMENSAQDTATTHTLKLTNLEVTGAEVNGNVQAGGLVGDVVSKYNSTQNIRNDSQVYLYSRIKLTDVTVTAPQTKTSGDGDIGNAGGVVGLDGGYSTVFNTASANITLKDVNVTGINTGGFLGQANSTLNSESGSKITICGESEVTGYGNVGGVVGAVTSGTATLNTVLDIDDLTVTRPENSSGVNAGGVIGKVSNNGKDTRLYKNVDISGITFNADKSSGGTIGGVIGLVGKADGKYDFKGQPIFTGSVTIDGISITAKSGDIGGVIGELDCNYSKDGVKGISLSNVTVKGSNDFKTIKTDNGDAAGVVGYLRGSQPLKLNNVVVENVKIAAKGYNAGGVVANVKGCELSFGGTVNTKNVDVSADQCAGGVLGQSDKKVTVNKTLTISSPTVTTTKSGGIAGGVIGRQNGGTLAVNGTTTINGVKVSATSGGDIGGMIGRFDCTQGDTTLSNVTVTGLDGFNTVSTPSGDAGGVIGFLVSSKKVTLKDVSVTNMQMSTGQYNAGGLVANAKSSSADSTSTLLMEGKNEVKNVKLTAADSAGGVVGKVQDNVTCTVKNVSITDGMLTGNANAGGVVGLVMSGGNSTVSGCNVYLATLNGINKESSRIIGSNAGGLVGGASGTLKVTGSMSATIVGQYGSTSSGGLVGQVTGGTTTIETSYADSYIYGANTGGMVGKNAGTVNLSNAYTAGYQYAKENAAGLVAGNLNSATNVYTIHYMTAQAGSTPNVYSTARAVSSSSKVFYAMHGTDVAGTAINKSQYDSAVKDTSTMVTALSLGDQFEKANANSKRYQLDGLTNAYVFPTLKSVANKGDWFTDIRAILEESSHLFYYERYTNKTSGNTYGVYGNGVDTLDKTNSQVIYEDGYCVLQTTGAVKFNGTDISGCTQISSEGKKFRIIPKSLSDVAFTDSTNFYHKVSVTTGGQTISCFYNPYFAKTALEGAENQMTPTGKMADGQMGDVVSVRTARQLCAMSKFYDPWFVNCTNSKTVFQQGHDIDYATYSWYSCGSTMSSAGDEANTRFVPYETVSSNRYNTVSLPSYLSYNYTLGTNNGGIGYCQNTVQWFSSNHSQPPIGREDKTAFTGTFDGNNYSIKNLSLGDGDLRPLAGLFGYNKGVVQNVKLNFDSTKDEKYKCSVILDRPNSNEDASNKKYGDEVSIGTLAAYNYGTIQNCAVSGYRLNVDAQGYQYAGTMYVGGVVGFNGTNGTMTNVKMETASGAADDTSKEIDFGTIKRRMISVQYGTTYGGNINAYSGDINFGDISVGGLIGCNQGTVSSCKMSAYYIQAKNATNNSSGQKERQCLRVGGVIGWNAGGSVQNTQLTTKNFTTRPRDIEVAYDSNLSTSADRRQNCRQTYVGGFVGVNEASISGSSVKEYRVYAYAEGGTNFDVGGFVGLNKSGATISNCTANTRKLALRTDSMTKTNRAYIGKFCGSNFGTLTSPINYSCDSVSKTGNYYTYGEKTGR